MSVVVLGEVLWDVFAARSRESLRARRSERRCLGGAPANVAVTLARLGVPVSMITAVGDDPLGDGLRDELAASGVDTRGVVTVRARTGLVFVDGGRFVPYRSGTADGLLPRDAADAFAPIDWLHLGSGSLHGECAHATRVALGRAARVSVDLNLYRWMSRDAELDALIDRAELLKVSEPDLRALSLTPDREGARALHARRPERITVATFGDRGAIALRGEDVIEVPARRATTVDPTGAGDAFMAGLIAALHGERDLSLALQLGSRLGARAVSAVGATTALRDLAAERAILARGAMR